LSLLTVHVGLVMSLLSMLPVGIKKILGSKQSTCEVNATALACVGCLNHKRNRTISSASPHRRMTERPTGIVGVYMTDFRKKDDKKAEEEKSDGPPSFAEDEGEEATTKGKGKEEQGDQAEFTLGQPIDEIEQEIQRLQNSIRHLERSNRDLEEALHEGFDEDFDLALRGTYLLFNTRES